jgi:hypothetical protein
MRDPKQMDKDINALRAAWHRNPELRLGQLVSNLAAGIIPASGGDPFYIEDADLALAARTEASRPRVKPLPD